MTRLHRNIAWNTKRLRQIAGLSQMELASRANLSTGYIGGIESGHKYPSAKSLEVLATALGVQPYVLLMAEEDFAPGAAPTAVEAALRFKVEVDKSYGDLMESLGQRQFAGQDERDDHRGQ